MIRQWVMVRGEQSQSPKVDLGKVYESGQPYGMTVACRATDREQIS
jgi:hypothetical protein